MFEKLGRFEIKGILGRGAMGEVYLGIDPSIGREVAIKTILASAAQADDAKERFSREAKAAGVLNHPNIVTIYEFGEDQGVLFIAMERVKGQDLEEMLRQRSITPGEALEVLAQVCDGLEFAHRNNIIHRDIKPSNIRVMRDGRRLQAKVMDFGVARLKDSEMTATGTVVGTVSYMAPEYIRTGIPDARSDLFAVGVMLYECISGRKPFEGDTTPTILYKIVNEPPEPVDLSQLREISPAIRSVLDTALMKNPDERYQSADDFAHALRAAKDPTWQGRVREATVQISSKAQSRSVPPPVILPPAAPTAGIPLPRPKSARSNVLAIVAVLGFVGLAVVGAGAYVFYRTMAHREPAVSSQAVTAPASIPPPAAEPLPAETPAPAPVSVPTPPPVASPAPPSVQVSSPAVPKNSVPAPLPAKAPVAAKAAALPEPTVTAAPEPPPAYGPPTTSQKGNSNVTLSEAISHADSNPSQAVEELKATIAADPKKANAYSWLVAVLYEQGRLSEIPAVLAKARQSGIPRSQLAANIRFRMAMQKYRNSHPGEAGGEE